MAKLREGIEIPIIPEDFVSADGGAPQKLSEELSQWTNDLHRSEAYVVEWFSVESALLSCPES